MREIKFRAWNKNVKQMADWDLILKECDRFSLLKNKDFVFMQYTGLKDKNGKEIYEGDIVKTIYDGDCKIIFEEGCFFAEGSDKEYFSTFCNEFEVIGNIYENQTR